MKGPLTGVACPISFCPQQTPEQVKRNSTVYVIDVMQHVLTEAVQQNHPAIRLDLTTFQGSRLSSVMEETQIAPDPSQF